MAITCSKARGPLLSRLVCNFVGGFLVSAQFRKGMQEFQTRIEKELAEGKHALPEQAKFATAQIGEAAALSLTET